MWLLRSQRNISIYKIKIKLNDSYQVAFTYCNYLRKYTNRIQLMANHVAIFVIKHDRNLSIKKITGYITVKLLWIIPYICSENIMSQVTFRLKRQSHQIRCGLWFNHVFELIFLNFLNLVTKWNQLSFRTLKQIYKFIKYKFTNKRYILDEITVKITIFHTSFLILGLIT